MGASKGTYEKVLELLKDIRNRWILDCGAGRGKFSQELFKLGAKVQSCDLNKNLFQYPNIPFKQVDLNKETLPYGNNYFDKVICIEVIEHLENPYFLFREVNRILKKNGQFILTTPNIENIKSRIQFFFKANFHWFNEEEFGENGSKHINPTSFKELEFIAKKGGFEIRRISTNRTDDYTLYIKETENLFKRATFKILNFICDLFYRFFSFFCLPTNKNRRFGDILILDLRKKE